MSQSVRLFCRDGRKLDLILDRASERSGKSGFQAQPRTDDDLRLASTIFAENGRENIIAQDQVDIALNVGDRQQARNDLGFRTDWLDYLEYLRLGHFIALQIVAPSNVKGCAESIASQRTYASSPEALQEAM